MPRKVASPEITSVVMSRFIVRGIVLCTATKASSDDYLRIPVDGQKKNGH
ncbi:hypothetical protein GDI1288 [Gluconacetobacter diazotrophicus PA1 5]|uniref:Uncharacterized protein n=1 Tax=Gluconacetobacter diazotrophicus (strain ATCC 49037 / DSM 5601 / CCUG 37298 / CIP 103539 / LMG 7603 / PAl5) TaxID=272568 RepID=A9HEG9_GLUDA|nr:hypothetical protein GDI1288 [Gluconacetobacter diazotrophicus PA1 5]